MVITMSSLHFRFGREYESADIIWQLISHFCSKTAQTCNMNDHISCNMLDCWCTYVYKKSTTAGLRIMHNNTSHEQAKASINTHPFSSQVTSKITGTGLLFRIDLLLSILKSLQGVLSCWLTSSFEPAHIILVCKVIGLNAMKCQRKAVPVNLL